MFFLHGILCLYSAFVYGLIEFLNNFLLAHNFDNFNSIPFGSCWIIDRG